MPNTFLVAPQIFEQYGVSVVSLLSCGKQMVIVPWLISICTTIYIQDFVLDKMCLWAVTNGENLK